MRTYVTTLLLSMLLATSTQAQYVRPYIPGLGYDTLAGDFNVFHPREYSDHARQVQEILDEFAVLLNDSLGFEERIDVLLLKCEDYQKIPWLRDEPCGVGFPTKDNVIVLETPPEKASVLGEYRRLLASA